jgi:hypothetical protein
MIQTLPERHMKERASPFGTEPATIRTKHPDHSATNILNDIVSQDRTRSISGMVQANF